MKILILGHGRNYNINNIRCSCYPVEKWFYENYTCVDIDPTINPDIVFDLRKDWTFCKENEFNLIVDTCGLAFIRNDYNTIFKNKIEKVLNENGLFYGFKNKCCQKINGKLVDVITENKFASIDRVKQMENVQNEGLELFKKKNADYGDAFANYGTVGVIVRMGDKIQRLVSVSDRQISLVDTETLRDTLIDLHNYAAMAIMLLDENTSSKSREILSKS
jgi:hypothetical protein